MVFVKVIPLYLLFLCSDVAEKVLAAVCAAAELNLKLKKSQQRGLSSLWISQSLHVLVRRMQL